jgi:hypothetical protein
MHKINVVECSKESITMVTFLSTVMEFWSYSDQRYSNAYDADKQVVGSSDISYAKMYLRTLHETASALPQSAKRRDPVARTNWLMIDVSNITALSFACSTTSPNPNGCKIAALPCHATHKREYSICTVQPQRKASSYILQVELWEEMECTVLDHDARNPAPCLLACCSTINTRILLFFPHLPFTRPLQPNPKGFCAAVITFVSTSRFSAETLLHDNRRGVQHGN